LKTYNDATLQLVSLTNKSLRTGYHDFVLRRLCGVCCAAMAVDRSAISTDQTLASRSRASFRSYDVARTSRPGRKAIVETSTVVYRPTQPQTQRVKGETASINEEAASDDDEVRDNDEQLQNDHIVAS